MGGGGYGNGTYKGVHIHQPKRWHTVTGKGMCAMMWYNPLFPISFLDLRFVFMIIRLIPLWVIYVLIFVFNVVLSYV